MRLLVGVLIGVVSLAVIPAAARASLSWSGPQAVDPEASGVALNRVACASVTQCTAVDGNGHAVTFDPQSPQAVTTAIVSSTTLSGIACPSTTQCTAVDLNGNETTFDPQSSAGGSPTLIDPSGDLLGVACPATTECIAVDFDGQSITFNPQAPGGAPAPTQLDPNHVLISVSCPGQSTTWCVAVDTSGYAIGFNPTGAADGPVQIDSAGSVTVQAAACSPAPSSTQCALVDNAANAFAFTAPPNAPPEPGSQGSAETGPNAAAPTALACPSNDTCVAVDGHGGESTFDPELPIAAPESVDPGQVLSDVACPTASQCTAVDRNGEEVTFNPGSPGNPTPMPIDGHTSLSSLACPTTGQCTAVDVGGSEVSFIPGSSTGRSTAVVDSSPTGLYGVSCPSISQCTTVDNHGSELTFDPASPGSPSSAVVASGHAVDGIACPSGVQCTAVDDAGQETTFNPRAPGTPNPVTVDSGHGLLAVACPTSTECSAVDDRGAEVTFDPLAPGRPVPDLIDRVPATALACPASTQCTAVDGDGDEVTFDPSLPSQASALAVDPNGQLSAIACRTPTDCVAVDQSGRVLEGDPHGVQAWTSHPLAGDPVTAIACPSARECVAVDQLGSTFLGSGGPLPPVPGNLARPSVRGLTQRGQTVTAGLGRWSLGPTSYTYQWERCTSAGKRCSPIARATAASYKLTRSDVGHRICVRVIAFNITGGGKPSASRTSAIVGGLVRSSHVSLSGVRSRAPRLGFALSSASGQQRMREILITLPGGLSIRGGRGIAVRSGRRALSYRVVAKGRTIRIALRAPVRTISIVVSAPELIAGTRLVRQVRSRRAKKLQLALAVTERNGGTTRLALGLVPR